MSVKLYSLEVVVSTVVLMPLATYGQADVGTAFTYQGQLKLSGSPYSGSVDLEFRLWDAEVGGSQVGPTLTFDGAGGNPPPINVVNGLFTVTLDFGADCFTSEARWLEITIDGTPLSQRQTIAPAPYALALPGLRTQQNATSPNLIGGYRGNIVEPGVAGATISGGGDTAQASRVTADYGRVGGGRGNLAGHISEVDAGPRATVGGGEANMATEDQSTVAGGYLNRAGQPWATVAGGWQNWAQSGYDTIRGGWGNRVDLITGFGTAGGGKVHKVSAHYGTIAGGGQSGPLIEGNNQVTDAYGTIGGGATNWAGNGDGDESNAQFATVAGGRHNTATASYSTIPGGGVDANWDVLRNVAAGEYSFAAGGRAAANHDGAFVWSSRSTSFASASPDEFAVCSAGGARFVTAIDGGGNPTAGVQLPPGGGSWSSLSDRNLKENFVPTDGRDVLTRLARVPISLWKYKGQDASIRHMGPMAQDFHAGFGMAEDDRHISSADADGVALAAIQGLYEVVQNQDAALCELRGRLERLQAIVSASRDTRTGGGR